MVEEIDGDFPLSLHDGEMSMFRMGALVFIQPVSAGAPDNTSSLTVELNNGVLGLASFGGGSSMGKREKVYGVIGMAKLLGGSVLAVITGREKVATLRGHPVYKVTGTKVIESNNSAAADDKKYVALLKHALDPNGAGPGLYFSYGADLTLSEQRFAALEADPTTKKKSLYLRADPHFFWNRNLVTPLIESEASHVVRFVLPLIQGFVEEIPAMKVGGQEGSLTLIARRSHNRPGVRHWRRGCDSQGAVANFVETEQLVNLQTGAGPVTASFVQVRGSIPLLWSQIPNIKYKPTTRIAPATAYASPFDRHINELLEEYQEVVALNLANQHGSEGQLSQKMLEQAERFAQTKGGFRLVPFDFHKECGASRYDRLDLLWCQISADVARFDYYLEGPEMSLRQRGVMRTNCIDCLDRTNVVQGWLARKQLEALLTRLAYLPDNQTLATAFPGVEVPFRIIWADHGDAISRQYAGTGALKSGFTRTGKRSLGGLIDDGIKSLTRYYLNNFEDGKKQDAYDLITGTYAVEKEKPSPFRAHSSPLPFFGFALVATLWSISTLTNVVSGRQALSATAVVQQIVMPALLAVALVMYVVKNGKKFVLPPQLCPDLAQPW